MTQHWYLDMLRDDLRKDSEEGDTAGLYGVRAHAHGAHMALVGINPELSTAFKVLRDEAAFAVELALKDAHRARMEGLRRMGGAHAQG